MVDDSLPLPPLRQELQLERATPASNGHPRWRLYDPICHRFFLVGSDDIALLSLWSLGTIGNIKSRLRLANQTMDERQLLGLWRFLEEHQLLQINSDKALSKLQDRHEKKQPQHWWQSFRWFSGGRWPLLSIDFFLNLFNPLIQWLGHRLWFGIWGGLTLIGLYFTGRQWDVFLASFSDFFSFSGMFAYLCALVFLKLFHELGHAYAARSFGCRVGRLGIATFMGWPMLYTELDDVARLDSPVHRMWIAGAGMFSEILVAGLATFFWAVLPEGTARSIAFVVATSGWLLSVLINLNPLARFDGYFLLSDALHQENLQPRALAWNRWLLDRLIIGRAALPPEIGSPRQIAALCGFGFCVWSYQLILVLGAAYLCYQQTFTMLGSIILGFAIYFWGIRPLFYRLRQWARTWPMLTTRRRWGWFLCLVTILILFFFPLDRQLTIPAVVNWQTVPIYASQPARLEELSVSNGQHVEAGQVLATFSSPELTFQLEAVKLRYQLVNLRLARVSGSAAELTESLVLRRQQEQLLADWQGLREQVKKLQWRAPKAGIIVDLASQLSIGQWVTPHQQIGTLLTVDNQQGVALLPERSLARLTSQKQAHFYPNDPSWTMLNVVVDEPDPSAITHITPFDLSSLAGGPIASQRDEAGLAVPLVAQHRLRFTVTDKIAVPIPMQLQGNVVLAVRPESLAEQAGRNLWHLLLSELRR